MQNDRQIVPADYFFNNDLKYLQGGSSTMTYTTSITKTRVAKYDLQGIEDMVPNLWSRVKHDVYSTKRILAVTQVKVMKWYGYGYLEEIKVRRADNQLYKFMEGDVLFDFAIALRMFIRRIVIQKRVEDLQLGVKSYQKKLNISRPDIRKRVPFTPYLDPQGFIYVDKYKRNRLMRPDELYKFSDSTLSSLRDTLKDIVSNLRMEYLPKKTWSNLEKRRARIMIKEIEKQLTERRIFRSLEKFVGGREYGNDLQLLQRTI
ncbi:hypothetical protein Tco_1337474 [Tanacetum coccineum]